MLELENCRVLVTGGAGFIGSACVWGLNKLGCERIVISDFLGTSEKWRNLVPLRFERYFEADDLLKEIDDGWLGKIDLVLHLGACSSTTETDAAYLIRNNYEYTRRLAEWALFRRARFLYASSAATYGDGGEGMADDCNPDYLNRLRPLNMYGYSKHLFDLHAARKAWFDRITGLKYFNVFGPNETHKGDMRSLVSKAFEQVRETGKLRLFKSHRPDFVHGEQKRDFLYVKDAVAATLHLARDPGATGLYNIGSGEAHSWNELAQALFAAMEREPQIEYIDMPEAIRANYQYFTQAPIERLREAGYEKSITPLKEAVADYVRNYLSTGGRLEQPGFHSFSHS